MHGTIERPHSIVLTERDYQEFFERLRTWWTCCLFLRDADVPVRRLRLNDPNFKQMYLRETRRLRDRYGRLYQRVAYAISGVPGEVPAELLAPSEPAADRRGWTVFWNRLPISGQMSGGEMHRSAR